MRKDALGCQGYSQWERLLNRWCDATGLDLCLGLSTTKTGFGEILLSLLELQSLQKIFLQSFEGIYRYILDNSTKITPSCSYI